VDRDGGKPGFFDNMGARPIRMPRGLEWRTYTIAGPVAADATGVALGLMVLNGDGPAYLDDVKLTVVGDPPPAEGPRALDERGLANLRALARLAAYIRFYHPSNEAAEVDWDRLTIAAVRRVEGAKTPDELAAALTAVFAPVAPLVTVSTKPIEDPQDAAWPTPAGSTPTGAVVWRHRGLLGMEGSPYKDSREDLPLDANPAERPGVGSCVTAALDGGVWARVPLAVMREGFSTIPKSQGAPALAEEDATGDDRGVRLAAVITLWGVIQHAFPYFDVVKTDWDAVLTDALRRAAEDKDGDAFTVTLQRMTAALHDGHGNVMSARPGMVGSLPLGLTFVGDEPVVLTTGRSAKAAGAKPGDVVVKVGGVSAAELIARARETEPAATEGFFKVRAARALVRVRSEEPVAVTLRGPDGAERVVSLPPGPVPPERTGPTIRELKPGVWYVDVDRASAAEIDAAAPKFAPARGVIFDVRGYPSKAGFAHLGHLTDKPLDSAQWHIPTPDWPDRRDLAFERSGWTLPVRKPRVTGRAVFITDGRAISAAETYMGIVEHYALGDIVGETTAGTNGNVNMVPLPGGYSVMYTGMKVLKHDGSTHHGVGIRPTVECRRTVAGIAAGRDEPLERAIELIEGAPAGGGKKD
jgi:C-terminal processing protease CtpA/Prc